YAKIANPDETAFWGINVTDTTGARVFSKTVDIKTTSYTATSIDFTLPGNFKNAELMFYKSQGTASIYADDIEVVQMTNPPALYYAQPSAAPAGGLGYPFGSRTVPYAAG